jgi:hypothetical protein
MYHKKVAAGTLRVDKEEVAAAKAAAYDYDHYNLPAPASKPTTDGEEGVSPPPCSLGGSAAAGEFSHTADSTSYSSSQGSFSLDSSSPKGASEESKPAKTLFKDNYADGSDNSEAAFPQNKPPKPKIITLSSGREESDSDESIWNQLMGL